MTTYDAWAIQRRRDGAKLDEIDSRLLSAFGHEAVGIARLWPDVEQRRKALDGWINLHPDKARIIRDVFAVKPGEPPPELHSAHHRRLYTLDDMLRSATPPEFVIEDLITQSSLSILAGAPGGGKTYALLDMALAVASGAEWLGRDTKKAGVLIVDEESGQRRLGLRLKYVMMGRGLMPNVDKTLSADLRLTCTTLAQYNLFTKPQEEAEALTAKVQEAQAGLVIIDSLVMLAAGADENNVRDMAPVMQALRGIAEYTRAALVVIHHTNKGAGDYRGSTAIAGAADLLIVMTTEQQDDEDKLLQFDIKKARDIPAGKFTGLAQWAADGGFTLTAQAGPGRASSYGKGEGFVLEFLRGANGQPVLSSEIYAAAAHAGNTPKPDTIKKAITRLKAAGELQSDDHPGKPSTLRLIPRCIAHPIPG